VLDSRSIFDKLKNLRKNMGLLKNKKEHLLPALFA